MGKRIGIFYLVLVELEREDRKIAKANGKVANDTSAPTPTPPKRGLSALRAVRCYLFFTSFIFMFSSCGVFLRKTPQEKLNDLIERFPQLAKCSLEKRVDTVHTQVTNFDTLFRSGGDTITITKNNITVREYHHHDTTWMKIEQPDLKILDTVTTAVTTLEYSRNYGVWHLITEFYDWAILVLVLVGCYLLVNYLKRRTTT